MSTSIPNSSSKPPGMVEKIGNFMTTKVIGPVQVWVL